MYIAAKGLDNTALLGLFGMHAIRNDNQSLDACTRRVRQASLTCSTMTQLLQHAIKQIQ